MEWGHKRRSFKHVLAWSRRINLRLGCTSCLASPTKSESCASPVFHGANDQEACLDWLDIQFGRSSRTWNNNLLFPWDFDKWKTSSKETVDLSRYLRTTSSIAAASVADWEKKAGDVRKSMEMDAGR